MKGKEVKPLNPRILESLNPIFVLNGLMHSQETMQKTTKLKTRHTKYNYKIVLFNLILITFL